MVSAVQREEHSNTSEYGICAYIVQVFYIRSFTIHHEINEINKTTHEKMGNMEEETTTTTITTTERKKVLQQKKKKERRENGDRDSKICKQI